mmetsp:Transcript_43035/g.124463  ORF Transcript_43035/g.124463 Transcript_43035/m.124463 type:complete len:670 (+) Transcript_43035:360-2369(+)|eukprot:CAMPEP_0176044522 /NCGR_PEP_ID=MMETSP0120_2-20121206/22097_1 /TAXON_ID=160619 /ORGANISM="Kryptoperidinium foliaceum, Strain CCMP 1326" /LENGTH=669 /DNA_ID=CAMNT_0017377927 /DNA_START=340 /DNA_END=2349 /DNA_ORIENTATION=-
MSSASKSTSQAQQFEVTAKKKFGKNLNKLTKPPPPSSAGNGNANKSNASSRNGLLLLSTKRPSSGANTASTGGILASKSAPGGTAKPLPSLGLQNKSNTSTHDALLGAVVGASRSESQEPDAWGIAEKGKSPVMESTLAETSFEMSSVPGDDPSADAEPAKGSYTPDRYEKDLPSTNWDEYGGRNYSAGNSPGLYNPKSDLAEVDTPAGRASENVQRTDDLSRRSDRSGHSQKHGQLDDDLGPPKPRTLYDPNKQSASPSVQNGRNGERPGDSNEFSRQPVIQISSYDDRTRGDRNACSAPRMLYDPKSGSMVAVPSRDDAGTNKGRKERGKKGKNSRDKDTKGDAKPDGENGKGSKKGRREKKQNTESVSPAKADNKKGKQSSERKLPRTCGVLYTRDNKGNYVSADGCDGDLGYGSHSIPGGRIKNASAYTAYLEDQKNNQGTAAFDGNGFQASYDDVNAGDEGIALETGFSVHKESQPVIKFEWVKPDEKIELVTGIDDSPTLQATAKEWAPSQAALAAAAARLDNGGVDRTASVDDGEGEEVEDEDDGPFGLGFDPTLNMDSMMQSPSAEPANGLDSVDLPSLSLEPAYSGPSKSNHIFAFGAGSTWGASDTGATANAWGAPSSTASAASFLNIPSGQTWGGMSAFAGTLSGSSLNGDTSRTTGD